MEDERITDEKLRDIYELTRLYDMYGALLNDHNRVIFEDYVLNNYSLGEIASEQDISRQGVRDTVLRCSVKLRDYEKRLGFVKKLDDAAEAIDELGGHIVSSEGISILTGLRRILEI